MGSNKARDTGGSPEQVKALTILLSRLRRWEDETNRDPTAVLYRELCASAGPPPLIKQES